MPDSTQLLRAVGELVRRTAREEIWPKFQKLVPTEIRSKGTLGDPTDVVTAVDEAVEALLGPALRALLPGSLVIGEEGTAADPNLLQLLQSQSPVWVIDPLDGTKNFVAGYTTFGSMVALVVDNQTELSVIYLPEADALFASARGVATSMGAFPRQFRSAPPQQSALDDRRLCGALHTHYIDPELAARLGSLAQHCDLVKPSGSAAVTYAELAQGALDFAFYGRLLPWDHAPGTFLVEQLGGVARFLDGQRYTPSHTSGALLVARTAAIWQAVRNWVG